MVKIGLEIHGYLNTCEKLFCTCKAIHGLKIVKPNTSICPICSGMPGAKPMLPNTEAVKKIIQIALIMNCKVNQKLIWQRKHYDWPDLPKGYQDTISGTYAIPVGVKGKFQNIRITEVHLEEDPAAWNPLTGEIDYNRSGAPLVEIVTEPDFKSPEQVADWLRQLTLTLSYIKAIDKNAGIKADVNISLPEKKGVRVEIKNVNSIKNIKTALEYEIKRQQKPGETPKTQETRMFDEKKAVTIKMRIKEQAEDYRFISDPDLPAVNIQKQRIEQLEKALPETPQIKLQKLIKKHKIDKKSAEILTKKLEIAEFFEKIIDQVHAKLAVPWTTIELLRVLNYNKKEIDEVQIFPEHFIELLKLIERGEITELKAKQILNSFIPKSYLISTKKSISKIIDKEQIKKITEKVIRDNKQAVSDYKAGKKQALNFLIGQVMKQTKKRADHKTTKEILEGMLK